MKIINGEEFITITLKHEEAEFINYVLSSIGSLKDARLRVFPKKIIKPYNEFLNGLEIITNVKIKKN